MEKGKLIVIEGVDGVGKSTQANLLANALRIQGQRVRLFSQPSKEGPAGVGLRAILQHEERIPQGLERELFHYDRIWQHQNCIEPALASGDTVILDRYYPSTLVYQCSGVMLSSYLAEAKRALPTPYVWLYLTLPVPLLLERLADRRGAKHSTEKVDLIAAHHERYERLFAQNTRRDIPGLAVRIETIEPADVVFRKVLSVVNYLENRPSWTYSHSTLNYCDMAEVFADRRSTSPEFTQLLSTSRAIAKALSEGKPTDDLVKNLVDIAHKIPKEEEG